MRNQKSFVIALVIIVVVVGIVYFFAAKPGSVPPTFTEVMEHSFPTTYTISYNSKLFPNLGTSTVYKKNNRIRIDSVGKAFGPGYETRLYATPTEFTQCAELPSEWFCYRRQDAPPAGSSGSWSVLANEFNRAELEGSGLNRDDAVNIPLIQATYVGESEIAERKAHCFDTVFSTYLAKPLRSCYDEQSSLLMQNDIIIAKAISFAPVQDEIFKFPESATIETRLTEKVKSIFLGNHD